MKRYMALVIVLIFMVVIIIPAAVVHLLRLPGTGVRVELGGPSIKMLFHETGQIREVPLEQYLVGVVAAEMPAEFELEALKAQAVASRTYVLKKVMLGTPNPHHPEADVCTNPAHCQGWVSTDEMQKRWGLWRYIGYKEKMDMAVYATRNMVISYQGQIIDPVYHSNAGGRTENSEDVWKYKIPYLRSVDSPWDKEAPRLRNVISYLLEEVDRKLGTSLAAQPVAKLTGPKAPALQVTAYSATGRIKEVRITGKTFTGNDLRRLLGLNSTNLTWEVKDGRLVFTTVGNGHGVGMSQYGANGMAKEGKDFRQIVAHYYTGTQITQYGK